jgi:hypothetical protein
MTRSKVPPVRRRPQTLQTNRGFKVEQPNTVGPCIAGDLRSNPDPHGRGDLRSKSCFPKLETRSRGHLHRRDHLRSNLEPKLETYSLTPASLGRPAW